MLRTASALHDLTIQATDGEIGHVDDLLFDDEHWTIRYLVVNTGGWLLGRRVLISPIAVTDTGWQAQMISVSLTRRQVEQSPDVDTELPVSRQQELEYFNYYGYQPYWGGTSLWGSGLYPGSLLAPGLVAPPVVPPAALSAPVSNDPQSSATHSDPHLHSSREVQGYAIHALDGEIGQVSDLIVDDATWTLRYLVIETGSWWSGKQVLIAPRWIRKITWMPAEVVVDLQRDTIKGAPPFDPARSLDRAYEEELHTYYQQPGYWQHERTA